MNQDILTKVENYVKEKFTSELPEAFKYHNFNHTMQVVSATRTLSKLAHFSDQQKELLIIAAYFHDLGFIVDPDTHEYESQKLAEAFLKENNFNLTDIEFVKEAIAATKMDWEGHHKHCLILKDADLSGLASENYSKINENLRKELNFRNKSQISKNDWCLDNIEFLKSHTYFTKEAETLYQNGKMENLEKLIVKSENKKKKKEPKLLTIGSSKSAQTQFKTALRNHIDLSSIADNKANIMLSVNAVIITVGLPLLLDKINTNPKLIIPTIILSLTSLISMIFATLATRPIAMTGVTYPEQIGQKKSNMFFFGNYYKMSFQQYEEGIKEVVSNNEILDNSITRDLFFLGKSLGKKYEHLRWCYNIFMFGVAATVISALIVFAL